MPTAPRRTATRRATTATGRTIPTTDRPNDPSEIHEEARADVHEEAREAYDAALTYIAYRERTVQEVRRKLNGRGVRPEIIESTIDRLTDVGLIDDERFVELHTRDRIARRPTGRRRLLDELYRKGVGRERALPVIDRVFREAGTDEGELARRAGAKRARALSGLDDRNVARRRLRGFLARRGFPPAIAREVVDELLPRARDGDAGEGSG